jgi:hypothetical protein
MTERSMKAIKRRNFTLLVAASYKKEIDLVSIYQDQTFLIDEVERLRKENKMLLQHREQLYKTVGGGEILPSIH